MQFSNVLLVVGALNQMKIQERGSVPDKPPRNRIRSKMDGPSISEWPFASNYCFKTDGHEYFKLNWTVIRLKLDDQMKSKSKRL